ncbi:MAG: S1 RNA-binding domain-containing protein [Candidatus Aenigmatarchaeota archaeon]
MSIVKKRGNPSIGEILICKVTHISPNSVTVHINEYDQEGLVHVSEVSRGWIRDIRRFIKQDQEVVAKVIGSDPISLSIKRVDDNQKKNKMREFKMEQRADKMLELAAEKLGKTVDQAYEEVGYGLRDRFGSVYEAMKKALHKPSELKKYASDEWIATLHEIAEKNIEQKEFEFRANVTIKTYKANGIKIIKDTLKRAEKSGLSVSYISAPRYLMRIKTLNPKKGHQELESKLKTLTASSPDCEINFEITE